MSCARRRCAKCTRPIVLSGRRQTGVYYTRAIGGGAVVRSPLCWGCYDAARGNVHRGRA